MQMRNEERERYKYRVERKEDVFPLFKLHGFQCQALPTTPVHINKCIQS